MHADSTHSTILESQTASANRVAKSFSGMAGDGVCPSMEDIVVLTAPNRNVGLGLFVALVVYAPVTLAWWWVRREHVWLRKRNFSLVVVTAVGAILHASTVGLVHFVGRDKFPCAFLGTASYLVVPLLVGPIVVRLILFANKADFAQLLLAQVSTSMHEFNPANFLKRSQVGRLWALVEYGILRRGRVADRRVEERSPSWPRSKRSSSSSTSSFTGVEALAAKSMVHPQDAEAPPHRTPSVTALGLRIQALFTSTTKGYASLLMLLLLLLAASIITYIFVRPGSPYSQGCYGCELSGGDFIPMVLQALVIFAMGIFCLFKLRGRDDPFEILHEIRMVWACGTVIVLVVILSAVDPGGLYFEKKVFDWQHLVSVALLVIHTILCPMQVLRTYEKIPKRRRRSPSSGSKESSRRGSEPTLTEVLSTPDGKDLFHQFLTTEFSVENILFLDSIGTFKNRYKPSLTTIKRAVVIYQTFIEERAMLQVNLSSKVRLEIADALEPFLTRNALTGRSTFLPRKQQRDDGLEADASTSSDNEDETMEEEDAVPRSLFNNAGQQIQHLLETDTFFRFQKSRFFQEWEEAAAEGLHV